MSHTIMSAWFCVFETSHEVQPILKGREIRFHLLKGSVSQTLWAHFKIPKPCLIREFLRGQSSGHMHRNHLGHGTNVGSQVSPHLMEQESEGGGWAVGRGQCG